MNTQNINPNEQDDEIIPSADNSCPESCDTNEYEQPQPSQDIPDGNTEPDSNTADNADCKTKKTLRTVVEYTEIFAFSVLAVLLIFSFMFRVCVVDGTSMYDTLDDGQKLLTENIFYTPKQGDIIVFYEGELQKPLVKRVIATGGQTVCIDYNTNKVSVDGTTLDEDYIFLPLGINTLLPNYSYNENTRIMTVTVPEGKLFVMGDNRNDSLDSRNSSVGCVDQSQVLGKVILRLSPFTVFN